MATTVHAFEFLEKPPGMFEASVCTLFGNEPLLKGMVMRQLAHLVGQGEDAELTLVRMEGASVEWRDVRDELSTRSLFGGGRRLVHLVDADDFVSAHREVLEDLTARPPSSGTLVLDVESWPSNTRLYKAVDQLGLAIECRAPERAQGKRKVLDEARTLSWLIRHCTRAHGAQLAPQAAQLLLKRVGKNLGLLDQELARLALYVPPSGKITEAIVEQSVGRWTAQTTWEMIDAAAAGEAAEALSQLDRLLASGEPVAAVFGSMSWSLRRYAAATRIFERAERQGESLSLPQALAQAGFRAWPADALPNAERQLRQLGRDRAGRLYRWLLETDLSLKRSHSAPARARQALEFLILRLSRHARRDPAAGC